MSMSQKYFRSKFLGRQNGPRKFVFSQLILRHLFGTKTLQHLY